MLGISVSLSAASPSLVLAAAQPVTGTTALDVLSLLNDPLQVTILECFSNRLVTDFNPPDLFVRPLNRRIEQLRGERPPAPDSEFAHTLLKFEPTLWECMHTTLNKNQQRERLVRRFYALRQATEESLAMAKLWTQPNQQFLEKLISSDTPAASPDAIMSLSRLHLSLSEFLSEHIGGDASLIKEAINLTTLLFADLIATTNVYEALQKRAKHDPKTGLLTLEAFKDELRAKFDRRFRGHRKKEYFDWVMMIDIDHFKKINDTYGHPVGDLVLEVVAHRLERGGVGARDMVSRYGGEEFIIFLPGTRQTQDRGPKVAKRLLRAIGKKPIYVSIDETPINFNVTVSIGITRFRGPTSRDDLFNVVDSAYTEAVAEADKALYAAKADGRNNIKTFKRPSTPEET